MDPRSSKSATLPASLHSYNSGVAGSSDDSPGFFSKLKKKFRLKNKGRYNVSLSTGDSENVSTVAFRQKNTETIHSDWLKGNVGRLEKNVIGQRCERSNSDHYTATNFSPRFGHSPIFKLRSSSLKENGKSKGIDHSQSSMYSDVQTPDVFVQDGDRGGGVKGNAYSPMYKGDKEWEIREDRKQGENRKSLLVEDEVRNEFLTDNVVDLDDPGKQGLKSSEVFPIDIDPGYETLDEVRKRMSSKTDHVATTIDSEKKTLLELSRLKGDDSQVKHSSYPLSAKEDEAFSRKLIAGNQSENRTKVNSGASNSVGELLSLDKGWGKTFEESPDHDLSLLHRELNISEDELENETGEPLIELKITEEDLRTSPSCLDDFIDFDPGYAQCSDLKSKSTEISFSKDKKTELETVPLSGPNEEKSGLFKPVEDIDDFDPGYSECSNVIPKSSEAKDEVHNHDNLEIPKPSISADISKQNVSELYANPQLLIRKKSQKKDNETETPSKQEPVSKTDNALVVDVTSVEIGQADALVENIDGPPLPARNYSMYAEGEAANKIELAVGAVNFSHSTPKIQSQINQKLDNLAIDINGNNSIESSLDNCVEDLDMSESFETDFERNLECLNDDENRINSIDEENSFKDTSLPNGFSSKECFKSYQLDENTMSVLKTDIDNSDNSNRNSKENYKDVLKNNKSPGADVLSNESQKLLFVSREGEQKIMTCSSDGESVDLDVTASSEKTSCVDLKEKESMPKDVTNLKELDIGPKVDGLPVPDTPWQPLIVDVNQQFIHHVFPTISPSCHSCKEIITETRSHEHDECVCSSSNKVDQYFSNEESTKSKPIQRENVDSSFHSESGLFESKNLEDSGIEKSVTQPTRQEATIDTEKANNSLGEPQALGISDSGIHEVNEHVVGANATYSELDNNTTHCATSTDEYGQQILKLDETYYKDDEPTHMSLTELQEAFRKSRFGGKGWEIDFKKDRSSSKARMDFKESWTLADAWSSTDQSKSPPESSSQSDISNTTSQTSTTSSEKESVCSSESSHPQTPDDVDAPPPLPPPPVGDRRSRSSLTRHMDESVEEEDDERPPVIPPRVKIRPPSRPGIHQDFMESMRQLKDCGWYWGPLSWEEAEVKLMGKPEGSFLVRDSSDERYILSLSFKSQGCVHHTRIEHHKGRFSFWSQPESHGKSTIKDFIEQCVNNSRNGRFLYFIRPSGPGAPPLPIHLLHPISRFVQMRSLQHMCRFRILQLVRRDHIDDLPIPTRIKNYLKETQYYVEYLDDD